MSRFDFDSFCSTLRSDISFKPNLTSSLIAEAILKAPKVDTILDIGCGNGAIGLYLKSKYPNVSIWGVESHLPSLELANHNANALGFKCNYVSPSFLDLALSHDPGIIINDVSGISSEVAENTGWFEHATGPEDVDGIAIALRIFDQLNNFRKKGSSPKIYFPIVSLCNKGKYLERLSVSYKLTFLRSENWPAPPVLQTREAGEILKSLKERQVVDYSLKFETTILNTELWEASFK